MSGTATMMHPTPAYPAGEAEHLHTPPAFEYCTIPSIPFHETKQERITTTTRKPDAQLLHISDQRPGRLYSIKPDSVEITRSIDNTSFDVRRASIREGTHRLRDTCRPPRLLS